MRNPSHRLLSAAALLLIPVGCQSPLRPNETADLKPRESLLGERFDEDAAKAKAQARKFGSQHSEAVASTRAPNDSAAGSDIAQAGYRSDSSAGQPAGSQQQTNPQPAPTPEAIQQHIRQGSEAMARRDWANAIFHYEAILSSDSRNPLAHQMLGRIGDQTQRFENAEYHYLRALSERPQDPNLLSDIGYSYLQQGRFQAAKRFLMKSLAIDANHQMAMANLAAVEAYTGNVDAALALLKQISSEQEAHETLHELLNRPAPAQRRDEQLLGQQGEDLPINEQMRIARERGRDERARKEARETLEMRERVRQAMALGGPLNRMGNGYGDDEISEIIAQIQRDDQQARASGQGAQYQPQQHATAPQNDPRYGGAPQFGAPPQSAPPSSGLPPMPPNGNPNQNYYPTPNVTPAPGSPGEWSTQTIPWQSGSGTRQLRNPLHGDGPGPQNFGTPNSQQRPMQNWQQPGQNQFPGNQPQWNGQPQYQGYPQGGTPAYPQQQGQWQAPPPQNLAPSGGQSTYPNPQQPFAPNSHAPGSANQYQNFPNNQQQFAPPGQFLTPPATSQPASEYNGTNQPGTANNGFGSQYVPPSNSGVWSPQGGVRSSYEGQTGAIRPSAIQQLGYQTPAGHTGSASNSQARRNSMRQAMRLGMAAGPGSLIQMDNQSPSASPQSGDASQPQQFFPQGTEQLADSPSSAVWNSGSNGSRITSPNQNLWQTGPASSNTRNMPPAGTGNSEQWQQLPSAQQQPQSSTWNHQNQLPTSPMRSQNWSAAESPGNNWQPDSFGASPTLNDSFAPAHMLDPNPARADTAPTMTTSTDQQGAPTTQNPGATRIPFTSRLQ